MIYDLFQVSNELANVYKLDALGGVYGDVPQVPAGPRWKVQEHVLGMWSAFCPASFWIVFL